MQFAGGVMHARELFLGLLVAVGLLACACEARPATRPSSTQVDKQALFGSASLVPTREGERVRRELAIAGELEQALAQLGLGPAHVDVELREKAAVIVIARRVADRSEPEIEAAIAKLASAMIPALEPASLHVWLLPAVVEQPQPDRDPSARAWLLMLASLGLGLSLGIGGERLRSRW